MHGTCYVLMPGTKMNIVFNTILRWEMERWADTVRRCYCRSTGQQDVIFWQYQYQALWHEGDYTSHAPTPRKLGGVAVALAEAGLLPFDASCVLALLRPSHSGVCFAGGICHHIQRSIKALAIPSQRASTTTLQCSQIEPHRPSLTMENTMMMTICESRDNLHSLHAYQDCLSASCCKADRVQYA